MSEEHAELAPSSAERTELCPGSVGMQKKHPGPAYTPESREGTAAHTVMARVLWGEVVKLGELIETPGGDPIACTAEMLKGADMLLESVRATLGEGWQSIIHVEERARSEVLHSKNWGTPDVWADKDGVLYIWDYKFGHGYVEVLRNRQILNYAALLRPSLTGRVVAVIVQPRMHHPDGKVRKWDFFLQHQQELLDGLRSAFAEAMGPMPRLIAGLKQCRNCSARGVCQEILRPVSHGIAEYLNR